MKDASIYIAECEGDGFASEGKPCFLCARMIRKAQIKDVIYLAKDGANVKVEKLKTLDTILTKI